MHAPITISSVVCLALLGCSAAGKHTANPPSTEAAVVRPGLEASQPTPPPAEPDGRYLVDHVYLCGGCHTPKLANGEYDRARYLAGVQCVFDVDPAPGRGCINSKNLTNHPLGLANVTDDRAIKTMFLEGRRPDGKALHPVMPYSEFHAMPAAHADAIVKHLRGVPGVDHFVPPSEPPFDQPPVAALPLLELSQLPDIPTDAPNAESARRGRELAGGACLGCHTPPAAEQGPGLPPIDMNRLFAGGRRFRTAVLRLASPPLPAVVYSQNLTPHASGLSGWTADEIVTVLKHGRDREGRGVCAPMPAGPKGEFAGLRDGDARDIANYLLTLPPVDNAPAAQCSVEPP